jgi:mannose-1-phosphate guanylyltransferase
MNAVILVGGGGTRLRPLTYGVPKALLPVLNRPLITHLLANLRRAGVDRVVFAANAAEKRIEAALGDGADLGLDISYSYEETPLGSGLAVKQAARAFDRAFLVCNGDVITDLDIEALTERHRDEGATVSIALARVDDPSAYGVAELDGRDRITRFVEKPPRGEATSNWVNAGTWVFEPEVLDHIADERMDRSVEQLVFPALIAEGLIIQGYRSDAYWMDVGTADRYRQLHEDLLMGLIPTWLPLDLAEGRPCLGEGTEVWPTANVSGRMLIGERCRIGGLAQVSGPGVIGDGCDVHEKAIVDRSILWSGVKIGAGAIVHNSIIGKDCWIGDEAVVVDAVIADGARVQRGVELARGARLEPNEVAS